MAQGKRLVLRPQGRAASPQRTPLVFSQRKAGKTMIYITLYREMQIWRTLTLQNACGRLKRKAVVSQESKRAIPRSRSSGPVNAASTGN